MKLNKPQFFLWATAILILSIGLISYDSQSVIDINVHDTYFVIQNFIITELIAGLLFLAGILYWIYQKANRTLNKLLTKAHLFLTIGGILAYPIVTTLLSWNDENGYSILNWVLPILILLVLIAQIFFILNLIIGLFQPNQTSATERQ